jgi:GTP cyclohydrolase I
MNKDKVKLLVSSLLCEIEGVEDSSKLRDGIKDTPRRVADMYEELLSGYDEECHTNLIKVFDPGYSDEELVISKNIPFHSLCEHHILPFFGTISVAYLSGKNRLIGISKLSRIVEKFARRLNIQEKMTNNICKFIFESKLKPNGVMVVAKAIHLCEVMRGVKKDSEMITSSAMGDALTDDKLRNEILTLLKND